MEGGTDTSEKTRTGRSSLTPQVPLQVPGSPRELVLYGSLTYRVTQTSGSLFMTEPVLNDPLKPVQGRGETRSQRVRQVTLSSNSLITKPRES